MLSLKFSKEESSNTVDTYFIFNNDIKIGECGFRHIPTKSEIAPKGFESHVFYNIYDKHQFKGYGKESLMLLLEKIKETSSMKEILITIQKQNTASQKVAESAGAKVIKNAFSEVTGIEYLQYKLEI